MRADRQSGFSLLEVMTAVAILSMALVAVFAASGGAVGATQHTQNITVGTMLARCKMTELEQAMRLEGFQLDDVDEEGVCCEDEDEAAEGYTCHWMIESVELPDVSAVQTAAGELAGGDPLGLAGPPDAEGNAPEASEGIDEGMMAGINLLYPVVSNVLQASIRRVTVEVRWTEGEQQRKVKAVQFVTNPTQGVEAGKAPPPSDDVPLDDGASGAGGTGTGTGSGTGTGTGTGGRQR
jgi:general secretion pathway protein I